MTLNWIWKVFYGQYRNMARASWFRGRWAKISWKNPWQQSHPLKIALEGLSFHFSISSFSIQFLIAAKSLGISTSVHRKVRGGFLYFFKPCWGDWEFSSGFLKLETPKRRGCLSTEAHHTSAVLQTSICWTANEYLFFYIHSITKGFKLSLTGSSLLSLYEGHSIFFGMVAFSSAISISYPTIIANSVDFDCYYFIIYSSSLCY